MTMLTAEIIKKQQTTNIVMITFWSQFSAYALESILILFLTRPLLMHGLGYDQAKAYAFMGISQATGYLMPILGGYMADHILGLRRSILFGSFLLASAYLLIMLSGHTIAQFGDKLFIIAYALTPAAGSLLMGTASGMVSRIYSDNATGAKTAMTFYYMAINVGALLATFIAPSLLESHYGPLSVLALTFVGKSIAAVNFLYRYKLYDNIVLYHDKIALSSKAKWQFFSYVTSIYVFTLYAYSHIFIASIIVSICCFLGMLGFVIKTCALQGESYYKQLIACLLIFEAVVFFVIYLQMNSTLILFAAQNTNDRLFGFAISPAQYQVINPILIITIGLQLPRFYKKFPRFTIPYQFAVGTLLASSALLFMAYMTTYHAHDGIISGNVIACTYFFITLAELCVSAIGLSMIGLYCDSQHLGVAMGAWYLSCSLASSLSGGIAQWVALPQTMSPQQSLPIYQDYYAWMGSIAFLLGLSMLLGAFLLHRFMKKRSFLLT
jgi:POT family proton-dependent oligopeptide transporter